MTIDWNGCWEDRSDRIICRWMVAWTNVCGVVAGCVGGYSGGGCFQLEKFIKNGDKFDIECNTDPSDKFGLDIIQATEDCQDLVLLFHDENMWLESDNLILNYDQVSNLVRENDLLIGGTDLPPNFNLLFEHIGLISAVRWLKGYSSRKDIFAHVGGKGACAMDPDPDLALSLLPCKGFKECHRSTILMVLDNDLDSYYTDGNHAIYIS